MIAAMLAPRIAAQAPVAIAKIDPSPMANQAVPIFGRPICEESPEPLALGNMAITGTMTARDITIMPTIGKIVCWINWP